MNNESSLYWLWLAEHCGIASREFGRLITHFQDPFELYQMNEDELEHLDGISAHLKLRLGDKALQSAYEILRYCQRYHVRILPYTDEAYPDRLRNIEDPPVLLYVLGNLPNLNHRLCIGMVGTRKMSEYGKQTAYTISYELAAANTVIVSGMARGVDGVAACGALAAGGETVAVLGCGISMAYPKEHRSLMKAIIRNGAVMTEYPPKEHPNGWNFPKRNRIISGISQGVLVVEGSAKSGALITARCAVEQGRELFALPGQVGESNSEGPNGLIQSGARVATCAQDILSTYDFLYGDVLNEEGRVRALRDPVPANSVFLRYGVSALYGESAAHGQSESVRSSTRKEAGRSVLEQSPKKPAGEEPDGKKDEEKNPSSPSRTIEEFPSLDPTTRRVYLALPEGTLFSADSLVCEQWSTVEVLTSLTMLELCGLVEAQPGGLYLKKSAENEDA